MSDFSDVDRSPSAHRLITYLDGTDAGLAAMKSYLAAAAARAVPGGTVLDVGCGIGHDLVRLAAAGCRPIGIDTSRVMLDAARGHHATTPTTVFGQADALALPFGSGAFDGCRLERVLQHVGAPDVALAEIARVVRPGGFLAAFEPDHTAFVIESDLAREGDLPARLLRTRHRNIGARLPDLVTTAGFVIDDVVTEWSYSDRLDHAPVDIAACFRRAVADGRIDGSTAEAWFAEQRERSARGTFRARWVKVVVIAHRSDDQRLRVASAG